MWRKWSERNYANRTLSGNPFEQFDLHWDNVSLLVQPASGNSIADLSSNGHAITVYGDATTSPDAPVGGIDSIAFDGTGDYLSVASSATLALGSGDFTIEAWLKSTKTTRFDFFQRYIGATNSSWTFGANITATRSLDFYLGNTLIATSGASAWPSGVWTHLAACRDSGTLRIFVDGTQVASAANTTNITDTATALLLGTNTLTINGNMTGWRITKSVARYTGAFTRPSLRFPTQGGTA